MEPYSILFGVDKAVEKDEADRGRIIGLDENTDIPLLIDG